MREANPCLCALRDRDGKVIEGQTGYVKVYRPEGSPPPNGYITIGYQRETLYWLCICPPVRNGGRQEATTGGRMRQRKIDPVEAYDMRQAGAKVKDLAARYKASCERVSEVISIEALRRFKASRANLVTPATHVIFTELADGWHGYWRDYHVGPCADYAATVQALQDALDARLMPREAA